MGVTKIEWTSTHNPDGTITPGYTFNPWEGCSKVSEGCKNCYAEERSKRFKTVEWGPGGTRRRTSKANWKKPLAWNKQAEAEGVRKRVFCASLADVFEDRPELHKWRTDLFTLILQTSNLDWLLLTKRPENVMPSIDAAFEIAQESDMSSDAKKSLFAWSLGALPNNVWIGTSVENQEQADKRIPELLKVPAKVRFLSMEPLLGPVDLRHFLTIFDHCPEDSEEEGCEGCHGLPNIDEHGECNAVFTKQLNWVICGGESGPHARPMHPDWARSLRDQCQAAGVPFLFKQWGEWVDVENLEDDWEGARRRHWPDSLSRLRMEHPPAHCIGGDTEVARVGKHAAGRELDGRTWDQFPEVHP